MPSQQRHANAQHARWQRESVSGATNTGRPYTSDDIKVLRDNTLTARQKAAALGRTFTAVRFAITKYKEEAS